MEIDLTITPPKISQRAAELRRTRFAWWKGWKALEAEGQDYSFCKAAFFKVSEELRKLNEL